MRIRLYTMLGMWVVLTVFVQAAYTQSKYEFRSVVGIDREVTDTTASVTFEVWRDGQKVFESGLMRSDTEPKQVSVDITLCKELRLVVTDGGDGQDCDHADWADAKIVELPSGKSWPLSDVIPTRWEQSAGVPIPDRSLDLNLLYFGDQVFPKGIGAHAPSTIVYANPLQVVQQEKTFRTRFGGARLRASVALAPAELLPPKEPPIAPSAEEPAPEPNNICRENYPTTAKLTISVGGKIVFDRQITSTPQEIDIPITGDLVFEVEPALRDVPARVTLAGAEISADKLSFPLSRIQGTLSISEVQYTEVQYPLWLDRWFDFADTSLDYSDRKIKLGGRVFESGLTLASGTKIIYNTWPIQICQRIGETEPDTGLFLQGVVGPQNNGTTARGTIDFMIFAGERLVFTTGKMDRFSAPQPFCVPIERTAPIRLLVQDAGDCNEGEGPGYHSDWAAFGNLTLVDRTFGEKLVLSDFRPNHEWHHGEDPFFLGEGPSHRPVQIGDVLFESGIVVHAFAVVDYPSYEDLKQRRADAQAALAEGLKSLGSVDPGIQNPAKEHFERVLELTPRDPVALSKLGYLCEKSDSERAMEYYKDALRDTPDDTETRIRYATLLRKSGQLDEYIVELNKCLATAQPSEDASIKDLIAESYRAKGWDKHECRPGVAYIGEDRDTLGDWMDNYGSEAYILLSAYGYDVPGGALWPLEYRLWAGPPEIHYWRWCGPLNCDDMFALWNPRHYVRCSSQADDGGENYGNDIDGPHLFVEIAVPEGRHRLALYFRHDICREYLVDVFNASDIEYKSPLVSFEVRQFSTGVYENLFVIGPTTLVVRIKRGESINATLSGIFLDCMKKPSALCQALPEAAEQWDSAPYLFMAQWGRWAVNQDAAAEQRFWVDLELAQLKLDFQTARRLSESYIGTLDQPAVEALLLCSDRIARQVAQEALVRRFPRSQRLEETLALLLVTWLEQGRHEKICDLLSWVEDRKDQYPDTVLQEVSFYARLGSDGPRSWPRARAIE